MIPTIVSFFTPAYADLAVLLVSDCDALGLRRDIKAVADRGSWALNCARKPTIIREALLALGHAEPVVWVDADARIRAAPTLLGDLGGCDFAVHRLRHSARRVEMLSGTIYVSGSLASLAVLAEWERLCAARITLETRWDQREVWDQSLLEEALAAV